MEDKVTASKNDGVARTFRDKETIWELIEKFKQMDRQVDMFEEEEIKCSWCSD